MQFVGRRNDRPAAIALHFAYYNFSLGTIKRSEFHPTEAGLARHIMDNSRTATKLIHKNLVSHIVSVFLFVLICYSRSDATTAIVILTADGMVITTDSKWGMEQTAIGNTGEYQSRKTIIVQNHITITCIGNCAFKLTHPGFPGDKIDYDFATWIATIERGLPDAVSFERFVAITKDEISKMTPKLGAPLRGGGIQHRTPWDVFERFATYVIAGYESGVPRLTVLEVYIDWDTETWHGPYQIPLEPSRKGSGHSGAYSFGIQDAHVEFLDPHSYAYKRTMSICPKALHDFITDRSIPLDEAVFLSRALVGIEEEANPKRVGGKIRSVEILSLSGKAIELNDGLPKKTPQSQPKKPH
jgi:hypothetical protein